MVGCVDGGEGGWEGGGKGGWGGMSSLEFKKSSCPLSLSLYISYIFSHVEASCRMSVLRKGRVALSNLRVQSPRVGFREGKLGICVA